MDKFTLAYIAAALWSSTDESREDGGDPLDENYTISDIDSDTLASMKVDCERFQEENRELLEASVQTSEQSGHDFWLTRNGHGAGFWDRGLGDLGDKLSEACKPWGEVNLCVGDDGKIYEF